jgi:hypothetical protein
VLPTRTCALICSNTSRSAASQVAPLGHPAVRRHSIVRVHADGCGYSTRVPCLKFPGISDGIRGRTDIANNRLTTNPTSSCLQMIKASSSTLESQQACELPPGRARLARRSQGRCHAYRNLPVNQRRRTTASCAVHCPAALAVAVMPVSERCRGAGTSARETYGLGGRPALRASCRPSSTASSSVDPRVSL